ncbi:MAG: FAD/NAD(P)-binding oxidoreductase [Chloroflexota bacterium]
MPGKNIVVLGGGSGGVVAATKLGQQLGADHNITLIDRRPVHTYQPDYLWLMLGLRNPRDMTRDLVRLERHNLTVFNAEVTHIDTDRRVIETNIHPVPYDYLVVSLGLQSHPEAVPGYEAATNHVWEMEPALRFRDQVADFSSGRFVAGVISSPYRCPPAPYETQWLLDKQWRKQGVRENIDMHFFSSESGPIGGTGAASDWIREHTAQRGVTFHWNFKVKEFDADAKVVRSEDGEEIAYDLAMVAPVQRPAQVLLDSGLAESTGVQVSLEDLSTKWENVYAIGDCANVPASKAGVVAHQEADHVAHRIAAELTGRHNEKFRLHTI